MRKMDKEVILGGVFGAIAIVALINTMYQAYLVSANLEK